ncbi:MAG: hypothetical protein AB7G75_04110 [Candidatus Binatia bacterium]
MLQHGMVVTWNGMVIKDGAELFEAASSTWLPKEFLYSRTFTSSKNNSPQLAIVAGFHNFRLLSEHWPAGQELFV